MNKEKAAHTGLQVVSSGSSLWEQFLEGDRHAFARIYDIHIDHLFHYGMHFCQDKERVKDCLQDLFQDLWLTRENLSVNVRNTRYYLISSLRRRLLRTLQKDRRRMLCETDNAFEFELIRPQEDKRILEETAEEQRRLLTEALARLTRRQREAIYLRFYQDLNYAEVAGIMNMQVDSVYNIISKAISILKKTISLPLLLVFLGK
ncbi:MAG TPA: sigma-70 family RNA polymerase sigma factor [Chitinophaga sp.]|uniref:RNA polymerase sigma factor n=1 Tax=Chitinophaga sp. TaxID=1869181 RepID=UPI002D0F279A|nr:sigma-70 family RNA polymerase sigma factor [Chitinophaga sp.]HVI45251.1 sigma-70 family RNA polymerase sigma factor [Chitinophaga sp.]